MLCVIVLDCCLLFVVWCMLCLFVACCLSFGACWLCLMFVDVIAVCCLLYDV